MSNKVAFLCPLYDTKNHFEFAYKLLKSKIDLGIEEDLYFVFSNFEQREKFSNLSYSRLGVYIRSIVLDSSLLSLKSQVVVKKFFGLKKLMKDYEYLSIIDSESLFIKKCNYYKLFNNIWESRNCLISNYSLDGFFNLERCYKTLGIYYNKKLLKEFRHYRLNFWFNEIPVYKCETLPDFFKWLDKFDINGWGNEWCCFEYYIYAAYLIIKKDFRLRPTKYSSMGGIVEYLTAFPIEKQYDILKNTGTHWSSNPTVINENTHLLFHLDRSVSMKEYSYNISLKYKLRMYCQMYRTIIKDIFVNKE